MSDQLQRMIKKLEGDGPVEKQIILLKLTEALEHAPYFGDKHRHCLEQTHYYYPSFNPCKTVSTDANSV